MFRMCSYREPIDSMKFNEACRFRTWTAELGRLAFRLGSDCFVALVRGRRPEEGDAAEVVGIGGVWTFRMNWFLHFSFPLKSFKSFKALFG